MTEQVTTEDSSIDSATSALSAGLCIGATEKKIMEVLGADGKKHPIYGDDFAAGAIADVLARLNELEAKAAQERGHDA